MAVIAPREVIDLIAMTLLLGYIFSGFIKRPHVNWEDFLRRPLFNWKDLQYSALIVAPAVVLHELGHKLVGIALGFTATFKAFYPGLLIGVAFKLANFPFIFFIPGFVEIPGGAGDPVSFSVVAFAGPAVNLILYVVATVLLRMDVHLGKYKHAVILTQRVNLWLFILNMLPIPGLDGSKVLSGIRQAFA
jgi:Zn-dependent protease